MDPQLRLDAAESAFFQRELESIEAELHNTDYPEIKYSKLVPVDENFAQGALSLTYRQFTGVGVAKIIHDRSKDLPRVDVYGEEVSTAVKSIGDAFGYSIMELKAAALAARNGHPGPSLDRQRANWAYEAIQRRLDYVAALGDTETGLKGMLNHASVSSATAANGATGSPLWTNKTPDEILADVNGMVSTIRDASKGVESPDTLLVPEAQYTHIATKRIPDTQITILQWLKQSQEWIKNVASWHYLKAAGAGSTDRIAAYRRDPMKLKLRNPHGFQQLEPRREGLEYIVECFMTTAGIVLYKPVSMYYLDGV